MKMNLNKIIPACLIALSMASCKDYVTEINIGHEQNLTTAISSPVAIFGDKVSFSVKIDGMNDTTLVMQEDIDVKISFKATDKDNNELKPEDVFEDFNPTMHIANGNQRGEVTYTVKSDISGFPVNVTLSAYTRGYQISPSERSFSITDKYYTTVSLRNNSDKVVSEGKSMVIVASTGSVAKEDVVVYITAEDPDKFETAIPEQLTIKKGFSSVETVPIKVKYNEGKNDFDNVKITFTSESASYPLAEGTEEMSVTVNDVDGDIGDNLHDERNLYTFPEEIFYSEGTAMEIKAWDDVKFADGRLMKYSDSHPNKKLAEGGWKFLNSLEFHPINSLTVGGKPNEWGNRIPRYMAMQAVENTQVYQAMNNNKYSNMTDEGYLMMWSAYSPGEQILEAGAGTRDYGVSGFYANKFKGGNAVNDTWESSNVRILAGTRVEIRARLRGHKKSFNAALWTQGNRDAGNNAVQWSAYGECDILENPAGSHTDNDAWQTFHWADNPNQSEQNDNHNPNNGGPQLGNMTEFNIYWLEWTDNNTIKMGINGKTEVTIERSQYPNQWNHWPFDDENFNTEGMHLLLTFGCGSDWALNMKGKPQEEIKKVVDETLKLIPYEGSKTNPNTPRMEIDWIRFYYKDNYQYKGDGVVTWKNYPMY